MNPELSLILTSLFPIILTALILRYILKLEKMEQRKWLLKVLSQDLNKIKNDSRKFLAATGTPRTIKKSDLNLPYWTMIQHYPKIQRFQKDPLFKEMFTTFREWEKIKAEI